MIVDCFPFFNEMDLLRLRLAVLDPIVDRFVIEESAETFSGAERELLFKKHEAMFEKYLPKITYIPVTERLEGAKTHERDYFQKNHLEKGIDDLSDDDIVIFGDLDEIPHPGTLMRLISEFDKEKVYHLAQDNFYVFMNMMETSGSLLSITGEFPDVPKDKRKWLGTKVCAKKHIPAEGIVRLRDLVPPGDERSVRVERGGWHFGYMGGLHESDVTRRIGDKVRAAAHQEYNDAEILKETMDHLILGEDIFGRDARFTQILPDGGYEYPEWLMDHRDEYAHLFMPEITAAKKLGARLDLTAGRFARKAVRKIGRMLRGGRQ